MPKPDVIARVKSDLEHGHTYRAIHRLRTYLAGDPDHLEIRVLLAEIYRQTGNPVEAGRWSYLADVVHPAELAAFERANPSPWLRLRLLHLAGDPAVLSPPARERLRVLREQAERIGPPPIWRGPVDAEEQPRSGVTLPCLFVAVVLTAFGALAGIGLYRAVMWVIHF